jgi:hypothetical protein
MHVNGRRSMRWPLAIRRHPEDTDGPAVLVDVVDLEVVDSFQSMGIPSTGEFFVGDRCCFSDPVVQGYMGAVCVETGSPGVWRRFGKLS